MADTVFVQRSAKGVITGVYARPQPGIAEEEIADAHSDVVGFRNPPRPASFMACDLIDLLSPDDLVAIEKIVEADVALRLLWLRLRTREGRPIAPKGEAFVAGWAGLMSALGAERTAEIAKALGIPGK